MQTVIQAGSCHCWHILETIFTPHCQREGGLTLTEMHSDQSFFFFAHMGFEHLHQMVLLCVKCAVFWELAPPLYEWTSSDCNRMKFCLCCNTDRVNEALGYYFVCACPISLSLPLRCVCIHVWVWTFMHGVFLTLCCCCNIHMVMALYNLMMTPYFSLSSEGHTAPPPPPPLSCLAALGILVLKQ